MYTWGALCGFYYFLSLRLRPSKTLNLLRKSALIPKPRHISIHHGCIYEERCVCFRTIGKLTKRLVASYRDSIVQHTSLCFMTETFQPQTNKRRARADKSGQVLSRMETMSVKGIKWREKCLSVCVWYTRYWLCKGQLENVRKGEWRISAILCRFVDSSKWVDYFLDYSVKLK